MELFSSHQVSEAKSYWIKCCIFFGNPGLEEALRKNTNYHCQLKSGLRSSMPGRAQYISGRRWNVTLCLPRRYLHFTGYTQRTQWIISSEWAGLNEPVDFSKPLGVLNGRKGCLCPSWAEVCRDGYKMQEKSAGIWGFKVSVMAKLKYSVLTPWQSSIKPRLELVYLLKGSPKAF